jgi:hypothetical protein
MRWAGHVARMGDRRNVYRVLVGKPKGKQPLRRPRHRWEDGIKMDHREFEWGVGVEWIHLAQDRDCWWAVMNAVMNLWVLCQRVSYNRYLFCFVIFKRVLVDFSVQCSMLWKNLYPEHPTSQPFWIKDPTPVLIYKIKVTRANTTLFVSVCACACVSLSLSHPHPSIVLIFICISNAFVLRQDYHIQPTFQYHELKH